MSYLFAYYCIKGLYCVVHQYFNTYIRKISSLIKYGKVLFNITISLSFVMPIVVFYKTNTISTFLNTEGVKKMTECCCSLSGFTIKI